MLLALSTPVSPFAPHEAHSLCTLLNPIIVPAQMVPRSIVSLLSGRCTAGHMHIALCSGLLAALCVLGKEQVEGRSRRVTSGGLPQSHTHIASAVVCPPISVVLAVQALPFGITTISISIGPGNAQFLLLLIYVAAAAAAAAVVALH